MSIPNAAFRPALLAAVALLASAATAHADVVELGAVRDTTLYQSDTGSLGNGAGSHFFAGATASGAARRGLIAFDVASIVPAGAQIVDVELTLSMSRATGPASEIGVHRVLADWGEGASDASGEEGGGAPSAPGDATWIHTFYDGALWSNPGGDFEADPAAVALVEALGFYTWSSSAMVSDVQAWLDDASTAFGWALLGDEAGFGTTKRFDTRENADAALRPVLRVEYVIPAPSALAALAVAGLVGARRRRDA